MRLEDLPRINELAAALKRLDEFAGPATLTIGDMLLELNAEETADFVDWKRGKIQAELQPLIGGNQRSEISDQKEIPVFKVRVRREEVAAMRQRKPVKPAKRLSRLAALAEARRRILEPFERELRARGGGLGEASEIAEDLAIYADKRRADIDKLARELMRGPQVKLCAVCGKPATTLIAGLDYCTADAKDAPRAEMPELRRAG